MKRIMLCLTAMAFMGFLACYLPVDVQCTADSECIGGASCVNNRCECANSAKPDKCDDKKSTFRCVNLQIDKNDCGACNNACGADQFCDRKETDTSKKCKSCGANGTKLCNLNCVDINTDPSNCGDCGRKCQTGEPCNNGTCGCTNGETLCGENCVDTNSDTKNCGGCGKACTGTQTCVAGNCEQCANDDKQKQCGKVCATLASNPKHCGKCDNACKAGEECCNGTCVDPTKAYTDTKNCGGCGQACEGNNVCEATKEDPSKFDCACQDKTQTSCKGACVNLKTDAKFCGDCNTACKDGSEICSVGKCCPTGSLNCNEQCKDVQSDTDNCGACGNSCGAQVCASGKCVACDATNKCPNGLTCDAGACVCGAGCGWVFSTALFAKTASGSRIHGKGITTDKDGNVYVTGSMRGDVQFQNNVAPPKTFGGLDIFVLKLNPRGGVIWVKVFGGAERDEGNAIAVTPDGKTILITGAFSDKVDFTPGGGQPTVLQAAKGSDAFVLALDQKGAVQYAIGGGSDGTDEFNSISVPNNNFAYVTGRGDDGAKFSGTTITAGGAKDVLFIARVDLNTKKFDKAIGLNSGGSVGNGIAADPGGSGDVFVTGECDNPIQWAGNANLCANPGMMILQFTKDLVKTNNATSSRGTSIGHGVALSTGSVANAVGSFFMSALFEKAFSSMGNDGIVTQLSGTKFANTVQASDPNTAADGDLLDIKVSQEGGKEVRWVAGYVSGTYDFGSNKVTTLGKGDIVAAQLDDQHKWTKSVTAGSTAEDRALGLAVNSQGGVLLTGYFSGKIENFTDSKGKVTITNRASEDLFVWKLP